MKSRSLFWPVALRSIVIGTIHRPLAVLVAILASTPSSAEGIPWREGGFSFTADSHVWISSGQSDFTIAGPNGVPNVYSELEWYGLDSVVFELGGTFRYLGEFVPPNEGGVFGIYGLALHVVGGFGAIGVGELRDRDYYGDNRTLLYSDTFSQVDADAVHYVNADVGLRILQWSQGEDPQGGFLELSAGGGFWQESYDARGLRKASFHPIDPEPLDSTVLTISETFLWKMIRLRMRGRIPLWAGFSFSGELVVVPWSSVEIVDVHHRRPKFLKDPSVILEGIGGWGIELNAMLSYRLGRFLDERSRWSALQGLSVEAGYRYWHIESGIGTGTFRKTTGTVMGRFNGATSERHGAIVGLELRF